MALQPQFAATPRVQAGAISTANTNLDGTGAIADCFNAGSNGSLVRKVTIQAKVTTTAGMVRLYVQISGTNYLIHEQAISAITKSATVAAFKATVTFYDANSDGMPLPNGAAIRASTEKAEAFNVIVEGGDY